MFPMTRGRAKLAEWPVKITEPPARASSAASCRNKRHVVMDKAASPATTTLGDGEEIKVILAAADTWNRPRSAHEERRAEEAHSGCRRGP